MAFSQKLLIPTGSYQTIKWVEFTVFVKGGWRLMQSFERLHDERGLPKLGMCKEEEGFPKSSNFMIT